MIVQTLDLEGSGKILRGTRWVENGIEEVDKARLWLESDEPMIDGPFSRRDVGVIRTLRNTVCEGWLGSLFTGKLSAEIRYESRDHLGLDGCRGGGLMMGLTLS